MKQDRLTLAHTAGRCPTPPSCVTPVGSSSQSWWTMDTRALRGRRQKTTNGGKRNTERKIKKHMIPLLQVFASSPSSRPLSISTRITRRSAERHASGARQPKSGQRMPPEATTTDNEHRSSTQTTREAKNYTPRTRTVRKTPVTQKPHFFLNVMRRYVEQAT